jgi:hypothetical protein
MKMANPTGSFGLVPTRYIDGRPYNGQTVKCYISESYATALFVGDPVLLSPTLAEKETTGKYPTINASDGLAGSLIRGVITGFEATNRDSLVYSPASEEAYAYVCMDKDVIYEIRGDGGGALTKVVPGQNAVMIATSAGDTNYGRSGFDLDEGTTTAPNTTQNFTLHIVALKNAEDNALGINAVYEVLLNTPELAAGRFVGITAA